MYFVVWGSLCVRRDVNRKEEERERERERERESVIETAEKSTHVRKREKKVRDNLKGKNNIFFAF